MALVVALGAVVADQREVLEQKSCRHQPQRPRRRSPSTGIRGLEISGGQLA